MAKRSCSAILPGPRIRQPGTTGGGSSWYEDNPLLAAGQSPRGFRFHPRTTLLDYLRLQERRVVSTKEGCAEGEYGACTVALGRVRGGRAHYEPINACILLLGQIDGAELVTVEDLAANGELHPVQAAMVSTHGSQCGFCTPGIVMSLFTLYHEGEPPLSRGAV